MRFSEWYYLLVAAFINSMFQYFWIKFFKSFTIQKTSLMVMIFISSFGISWGLDVIQRAYDISSYFNILRISLGCWLMFSVASSAKHYLLNGLTPKTFLRDFTGELIGYFLMGSTIYLLT